MSIRVRTNYLVIAACFYLTLSFALAVSVECAETPKEIKIGTSILLTGKGAAFGPYMKWGYSTPIDDINKSGGLYLSKYGKKLPVNLIVYDDESRPEKAAQNIERLILKDKVCALLSPAGPPTVIPTGIIAEREKIPMVAALCPIRAFLSAGKQWNYVWDVFFDELEMTEQQFLLMDTVESNRKVALFTNNDPDGVVMGNFWSKNAQKFKYEVVYHAKFPVMTTEFSDLIRRAQEGQAEIMIGQCYVPEAIALWRQMRVLGYKPKAAFFEKGGEPAEWWKANGQAAQGTCVTGYWHPSLGYPGAKDLRQRFEKETGLPYSQHIADTYAICQILLDAIRRAGSLDPKEINGAISETNKTFVVGPVKFKRGGPDGNTCGLSSVVLQWQNGETQIVYPKKLATAGFICPLP